MSYPSFRESSEENFRKIGIWSITFSELALEIRQFFQAKIPSLLFFHLKKSLHPFADNNQLSQGGNVICISRDKRPALYKKQQPQIDVIFP